jgi:hypothetical protein
LTCEASESWQTQSWVIFEEGKSLQELCGIGFLVLKGLYERVFNGEQVLAIVYTDGIHILSG